MAPLRKQLQELSYSPVSRVTVQEHVYGRLRELILNGGIEPGRTVTVVSLSEAFGVSAMPVREALHRLVAEKALTVVTGRSVGIPLLTAQRLHDLRRVRVAVEGTATEWAAQRLTASDLAELDRLIDQMETAKAEKNREVYVPANREFHFMIYRAADFETLLSLIEIAVAADWSLLQSAQDHRQLAHRQYRTPGDARGAGPQGWRCGPRSAET